jgi:hypothetical protein
MDQNHYVIPYEYLDQTKEINALRAQLAAKDTVIADMRESLDRIADCASYTGTKAVMIGNKKIILEISEAVLAKYPDKDASITAHTDDEGEGA